MIIVKKKKGEYWTEHRKFKKTKQRKKNKKIQKEYWIDDSIMNAINVQKLIKN